MKRLMLFVLCLLALAGCRDNPPQVAPGPGWMMVIPNTSASSAALSPTGSPSCVCRVTQQSVGGVLEWMSMT